MPIVYCLERWITLTTETRFGHVKLHSILPVQAADPRLILPLFKQFISAITASPSSPQRLNRDLALCKSDDVTIDRMTNAGGVSNPFRSVCPPNRAACV